MDVEHLTAAGAAAETVWYQRHFARVAAEAPESPHYPARQRHRIYNRCAFSGDATLFDVRPATFSTNPPRADVGAGEVRFTFTRTDNNGSALKADYLSALTNVKQYLAWLALIHED